MKSFRTIGASFLLGILEFCGVDAIGRYLHRDDLLVLLYHGVVERYVDELVHHNFITTAEFSQHLGFVSRHFNPVSVRDVYRSIRDKHPLPRRSVLITFDDGYKSSLGAATLLKQHGIPAVFHISTGYIGTRRMLWPDEITSLIANWSDRDLRQPLLNGHIEMLGLGIEKRMKIAERIREQCKLLPDDLRREYIDYLRSTGNIDLAHSTLGAYEFLTWEDVRNLVDQGFDVGSHTIEHPVLSRLRQPELQMELHQSKSTIEHKLGTECLSLAYPNGSLSDYTDEVISAAAAAGYSIAFIVSGRFHTRDEDALHISRIGATRNRPMIFFRSTVSGVKSSLAKAVHHKNAPAA